MESFENKIFGEIRLYKQADLRHVVKLFVDIQKHTNGLYPPKKLVRQLYGQGRKGIRSWLTKSPNSTHLLFVNNKHIIGHIEIQDLGSVDSSDIPYWENAFLSNQSKELIPSLQIKDLAVIKRFGIDPKLQGRKIGTQLLQVAIKTIEQDMHKIPSLVVLSELENARKLYENTGGKLVGTFTEDTGETLMSYLFY